MGLVYIGKIVSTHGIKGEIKILSDFEFKDKVFVVGNKLIIDDVNYEIKSYRHHKTYEMVTLDDYKDINEVLFLMKKKVYFDEDDLVLDDNEILDDDLITYKVLTSDGKKGIIKEIFLASPKNKVIRIQLDKEVLIPLNSPMIKEISKERKEVIVELVDGM
ncbi:MAG: 16S rRNA processing protein RimM [Bacilli bacterium]|nr:16S rRNA processing protein RimM [Bacilli bacterium]MBR3048947.1 16S rRNA processing protein RimM [Bacilli bacterium]